MGSHANTVGAAGAGQHRLKWRHFSPALTKLLGHVNPEMTMRYVDVVGTDLQREFHWPDPSPGISCRNRKPQARRAAVWTV